MTVTADKTSDPSPDFALSAKYAADLQSRVDRVAKRAVRTVRFRAILLVAVTVGFALLIAAAWDAWWRFSEPAMRWVLFALIVFAAGTAVVYWLIPAFKLRLSVIEAARKIESFFPELGDRLSSVVALNEPPQAARSVQSEELVQRGTVETFQRTDAYDLTEALKPHRNRRLAMVGIVILGIFVLVFSLLPQQAPLALKRVTMPWVEASWPRQHVLEIEPLPRRLHAGSDLVVTIRDRQGRLPGDLTVWVRRDSHGEPMRLPLVESPEEANASGEATTTAIIPVNQVEDAFAVRVVGGDDHTMSWHEVEVVSPPRIRSERFRISPPEYTGLPTFETDDPVFSVLAGSRVQFEATVDRPLETAEWSMPTEAALHIGGDGTLLESAWAMPASVRSQRLSIKWLDRENVPGRSAKSWTINVEPDQPPRLTWHDLPSSIRISSKAAIPLEWRASDDFGLAQSWMETTVTPPSSSGEGSEHGDAEQHFREDARAADDRPVPQKLRRSEMLALSSFESMPAGAIVEVVGVAADTAGQRGATEPYLFRVLADEELQARLADRGKKILEQVREAKGQQQLALERTEEARGRLGDDPASKQAAADMLRIAGAAQDATLRQLDGGPQAAIDAAKTLLQEAEINQLDNNLVSAITEATRQLETARDQAVLPANGSLQNASDQLQSERPESQSIDPLLQDAIADQQRSAGELQEIIDSLSASLQVQSVAQSIDEIADAQRRLTGATVRSDEASRPEAERGRLSASQKSLARQTEQLQSELEQLADSAEQSAERRQRFADASERLLQQRAPQRMREAAENLREQRVGDSIAQQREIAEDLANVARDLQQGESTGRDADDRSEWLREAIRIADRQATIVDAMVEVTRLEGVGSDRVVSDQQDHARRTEQFARKIDALPLFGDVARSAHRDMLAAAARLERNATDVRASTDAEAAAEQMREIAAALQSAAANEPLDSATDEQEPPERGEPPEEAEPATVPLETVFLIRTVQARLQADTKQLETLQQQDVSPQERREIERKRQNITNQQSRLMEQLNELVQERQGNHE